MATARTWWKSVTANLKASSTVRPAGDIITTTDEAGFRVADGATQDKSLPGMAWNAAGQWWTGTIAGVVRDAAGRTWAHFLTDGTTLIHKLQATKATVNGALTLGSLLLNPAATDQWLGDAGAFVDSAGRAWVVFRKDGSVTLKLAADSQIPAALIPTAEVAAARGSRTDLNTRLSSGLNAYGYPKDYTANGYWLRWTRMLVRKLLLGDAGTQFDVLLIGDSYTHSQTRWSGPFWTVLKSLLGDAGIGWVGFSYPTGTPSAQNGSVRADTTVAVTGTWTTNYYGLLSPDLGEIASSTAGDHIDVTFPAGQSTAKLYFKAAGGASVTAQFNGGGALQTVDLSVAGVGAGGLGVATLTAPPAGATTLTLTVAAGTVTLCGVDIRNGNNGVRVHKIAATGSSAQQWASVTAAAWASGIASIKPQLVVLMHGANDQTSGTSASAFAGFWQTIKNNLDTALGGTTYDMLMMMPPENQRGLSPTMASYSAAVQPTAESSKAAFLDLQLLFGEQASDYAFGSARPWFASDNLHPDPNTGGRVITEAVTRVVLDR